MSIELTSLETGLKFNLMVSSIKYYRACETEISKSPYARVILLDNEKIDVVEIETEIKAKIDAVDYLKKISQYLDSMDSAIDDIKHGIRGLRR